MKLISLLCLAIVFSARAAQAQTTDTALLFVHYKFSHLRDTTNRDHPYTENMILAVGKKAGVYRSYDYQLSAAADKKTLQDAVANSGGGPVRFKRQVTGSGAVYFQYPNENKMVRKESLFGSYLITGPLPVIHWQITGDTMGFGGLLCQKATGHFKGRDYVAWFCPDLPLHIGPWELNGLPGVIVEAYDVRKEVWFHFDGIEKAALLAKNADATAAGLPGNHPGLPPMLGMDDNSDPGLIQPPADAIKTSEKEFAKLQEAFRKDPNAFAQSVMAARNAGNPGDKMVINFKGGPAGPAGPVINNPIELPERP